MCCGRQSIAAATLAPYRSSAFMAGFSTHADGQRHKPWPTFRMAQTPVQPYLPKLLERIEKGEIDPSFVITHRATLEEGPELYKTFRAKKDGCIKVVMRPNG
jgi:threonine dehydrogenase-like Zn-dependent dehydrogenase